MKKVIEQKGKLIGDIHVRADEYGMIEVVQPWGCDEVDSIVIEKSKAREVSMAICPELGDPTIKTDNTKVILHLESEIEKLNQQLETGANQYSFVVVELEKAKELLCKVVDGEFTLDELITFLDEGKK